MSRPTYVYSVQHSEGFFYVPTKAEALRQAREIRGSGEDNVEVTRIGIAGGLRRRDLYCRLLNSEGFAVSHEEVSS